MNWIQGILLGLITGISEFFPISAPAHRELMKHLTGVSGKDPVLELLCSLAALVALFTVNRGLFETIRRDHLQMQLRSRSARRGSRDLQVVRNAVVPMLIGYILLTYVTGSTITLPFISLFLLLNGVVLFIPSRLLQGNKDARSMSGLDSLLIGLTGALSSFTGLSRIALQTSVARIRGADSSNAVNWSLLLSIPALILSCIISLLSVFTGLGTIHFSCGVFTYILIFFSAFTGSILSAFFIKILATKNSLSLFAYYCWGAALFTFIIYLV